MATAGSQWKLNDDGTDSGSNSNDLTGHNTPAYVAAITNNGLDGNGSRYFNISAPSNLVNNSFSVSYWYKRGSNNVDEICLAYGNWTESTAWFSSMPNTNYITFNYKSGGIVDTVSSNDTVSTNTWYHVVCVKDGTTTKMYVDSVLQTDTETVAATTLTPTTDTFYVGAGNVGGVTQQVNGILDEVRYYDVALSLSDVQDLYNGGSGTEENPVLSGTNTQINIGDDWKAIESMQINIGDAWKAVEGAQINIGDTWKTIF